MIESPFRMCAKIPQKMCIFESEADCLIFIMGEIMKKRLFSVIVVLALIMGMMPMNVSAATTHKVKSVEFDIEAPVEGKCPQSKSEIEIPKNKGYMISTVDWYEGTNSNKMPESATFVRGTKYRVVVTLGNDVGYNWWDYGHNEPKQYVFDPAVVGTINGKTGRADKVASDYRSCSFKFEYTCLANDPDAKISELEITGLKMNGGDTNHFENMSYSNKHINDNKAITVSAIVNTMCSVLGISKEEMAKVSTMTSEELEKFTDEKVKNATTEQKQSIFVVVFGYLLAGNSLEKYDAATNTWSGLLDEVPLIEGEKYRYKISLVPDSGYVLNDGYVVKVVGADKVETGVDPAFRTKIATIDFIAGPNPNPNPNPNPGPNPDPKPGEDPIPGAMGFKDVAKGKWYYEAVEFVYKNGIMSGKSAEVFDPVADITRQEFVTVLYNYMGKPAVSGDFNVFSDIPAGKWFSAPVQWGYENKILAGKSADTFGLGLVTRQEAAQFMYNFAKFKGLNVDNKADLGMFVDGAEISDWAKDAVGYAAYTGLMKGKGGGVFDPKANLTRAEVAQLIMNFIKSLPN